MINVSKVFNDRPKVFKTDLEKEVYDTLDKLKIEYNRVVTDEAITMEDCVNIKNALDNKPIYLYGNGLNKREWISVDDNNNAIDYILHNGINGEIYNISSGIEIDNLSITKIILNILNKDNSLIQFTNDRIIHDKRYGIDASKLEKLGFKLKKYDENKLINLLKIYIDTKIK